MGGFDVIMTRDFYQVLMFWDSWFFSSKNIGFNILAINFWHENVKCYELHKIIRQNDVHFINIVNRFQIASQTNEDIHFMTNFCLRPPLMDNTLPHLFYTNLKTIAHNKIVYEKTHGIKHINFSQKIFILKHVFISNCQYYHHISGLHHELLV
jgi:hypothetical protein